MVPGYAGDVRDKQAIFDFVWQFQTEQGRPAGDSANGCYYRIDGRCCGGRLFDS